jgi:hypothetical protein
MNVTISNSVNYACAFKLVGVAKKDLPIYKVILGIRKEERK